MPPQADAPRDADYGHGVPQHRCVSAGRCGRAVMPLDAPGVVAPASRHGWLTRYETTNTAVHTASDYQILSESRDLTCAWKKRSDRKNVDVRTGVTSFRFDADTFSCASTRIVRDCERVRRGTRYANDEF